MRLDLLSVGARRAWAMFCMSLVMVSGVGWASRSASAEDLWVADSNSWPGVILVSEGGTALRQTYRRSLTPPTGASDAIPRIGAVAPTSHNLVQYMISGLDRYMFKLDHGRLVHIHTHSAQIRDLALGSDPNVIYYSVLPTPQGDQPVGYGEIFSYNVATREQRLEKTVQQRDLSGNWWGAFTLHQGAFFVSTFDSPSTIYKLTSTGAEPIFSSTGLAIRGFDFSPTGELFFAASDGNVYRSPDLQTFRLEVPGGGNRPTDVALRR